jgi:hypothetical protein
MWIEKLADGVLELDTPIGPRYVQLNFAQRAYLLWTFRNFFSLPQQVLLPWERRLVDRLLSENSFVSMSMMDAHRRPVIGRIERRAPVQAEVLPLRKSPVREASRQAVRQGISSSNPAGVEPSQEAASA